MKRNKKSAECKIYLLFSAFPPIIGTAAKFIYEEIFNMEEKMEEMMEEKVEEKTEEHT